MQANSSTTKPSGELKRVLTSVSRLRPLPGNVTRLLQVIDDPGVTAGMVADMLSLDQALTAYVLRVSNSAQLGYSSTCSSAKEAVMRLGFKQVRALALSTVVAGPLTRRLSGYRLGNGELWQHSIETATKARWLAQAFSYSAPEEAYAAGLLHDMGKLLLDQFVYSDYPRLVAAMNKNEKTLWQAEEQLFGIDHAGVGGLMATQWSFPAPLSEAIRCHHAPGLASSQQKLAAIVNLANAFSALDPKKGSISENRTYHPDSLLILGLDVNILARLRIAMLKALAQMDLSSLVPDV